MFLHVLPVSIWVSYESSGFSDVNVHVCDKHILGVSPPLVQCSMDRLWIPHDHNKDKEIPENE